MPSVPFDQAPVQVLTLVYAIVNNHILTLERSPNKKFLPNWLVGLGGKVEPAETVSQAAVREFTEESGLRPLGLTLRGTYTFFTQTPSNRCGVIYIYTASGVEGTFSPAVPDGTLHWLPLENLLASTKVMPDHKIFLQNIFTSPDHFACVASWTEGQTASDSATPLEWADSRAYFQALSEKTQAA